MPIIKEYRCDSCESDFEGFTDICPACLGGGRRVFNTPFGLSKGIAKRTDSIMADQFKKKGITNYSNRDGVSHVTRAEKRLSGSRSSGGQPEIAAFNGLQGLSAQGFDPRRFQQTRVENGSMSTIPFQVPRVEGMGVQMPMGAKVGQAPTELMKNTHVIGGVDISGRQIVRVK